MRPEKWALVGAIVTTLSITALYALRPKPQSDVASRIRSNEQARSTITKLQLYVESSYREVAQWSRYPHRDRNVAIRDLMGIKETPSALRKMTANYLKRYGTTICNLEEEMAYSPTAEDLASTVTDERYIRPRRTENSELYELKRNALRSAYFYMDHARNALSKCMDDLKMRQQDLQIERLELGREAGD